MSLPESRNTTYAAGSEVKSDDLNDVQDQIIALHNEGAYFDTPRWRQVNLQALATPNASIAWHSNGGTAEFTSEASGDLALWGLPVEDGDVLHGLSVRASAPGASSTFVAQLRKKAPGSGDGGAQIGTDLDIEGSTDTAARLTGLEETVEVDTMYFVKAVIGGTVDSGQVTKVHSIWILVSHPRP